MFKIAWIVSSVVAALCATGGFDWRLRGLALVMAADAAPGSWLLVNRLVGLFA